MGERSLFTATVYPADVTLPITYSWQATDQFTISVSRPLRATSRSYSWSTSGTKYIRVTSENAHGTISGDTALEVDEERAYIIVYDGKVWPRAKKLSPDTLGFRCATQP